MLNLGGRLAPRLRRTLMTAMVVDAFRPFTCGGTLVPRSRDAAATVVEEVGGSVVAVVVAVW